MVKLIRPQQHLSARGFAWTEGFQPFTVRLIGVATVPTVLMAGATIVHVRRREIARRGSLPVLGVLTAVLALVRFVWCTF
ncbi:hypothetical protein [Microlunatus sp. GCM10028923]|uniref:hypothetical protein n=1 Tax=Microlunatus sp. GCM10028923 TaxID=3273400 RepID=UPI00360CB4F9